MNTAPRPDASRIDEPYPLAHQPDGRSWTARENLADILERELLGPANGPREILDVTPDSVYLVGRIAPQKLEPDGKEIGEAGSDEAASDVGDDADASLGRGVPVTAVDESTAGSEDDTADDSPPKRGLMIPASMGLRFQLHKDVTEFAITAEWGTYEPVPAAELPEDKKAQYRRTSVTLTRTIAVADLGEQPHRVVLKDDVVLRVQAYAQEHQRLIEVALCNDKVAPRKIPVSQWLYQTKLTVSADDDPVFLPVRDPYAEKYEEHDAEVRRLGLQYRDRLEYAVGRTCSVDWDANPKERKATKLWTTWLPTTETPQTIAGQVPGAVLDMTKLAQASISELRAGLAPIVDGYAAWLDGENARAAALPKRLRDEARDAVAEAGKVRDQLADGLEFLLGDAEALRCFRFMNEVMAQQRVHTQIAALRSAEGDLSIDEARARVLAGDHPHSWRPFQLAFVLMQLRGLTDPAHANRHGRKAAAQLLFFPTGGGKTEAYLGLAAYTFAIRRRQGTVASADGDLDGSDGVAVLMRYTLRLLTAQQFQRATALVCAAEVARAAQPDVWGEKPFRIGLWVGTNVTPKSFEQAKEQLKKAREGYARQLTLLQFERCPWCGTKIDSENVGEDPAARRIYVYCANDFGGCPFVEGGEIDGGLPVLTVDEEIYRLTPAFLIATVDKFARLAREGEAASLFGYVSQRCPRHGYVHPDTKACEVQGGKHHALPGHPAVRPHPVSRLRPPDLIIQDELHLISGALGTTVGLFEVAVDVMATWHTPDARPVRPMVVASTATARNAVDQVRAIYGRAATIFPPQVIDVGDTFFAKELPVSDTNPGRRYLGISTTGVRLTTAEVRVSEVLLAAGQALLDQSGVAADPYMSLVGYFSATRELAGMARYLNDDVQSALFTKRRWSNLPRRTGAGFAALHIAELTSRVSSTDIGRTLDQMALPFDPDFDSNAAKRRSQELREQGKKAPSRGAAPFDVVLATSMLQVGVDVTRLGLMLVVGQPKNTAEYIQASSRVGRDNNRPGLVVSLGNWARPRDLAHFEQFRHYHETFYSQVEALSVTPFSGTSIDRGVDGILVSAARVLSANRGGDGLSPEKNARLIGEERAFVDRLVGTLTERIRYATYGDREVDQAFARLKNRVDQWVKRRALLLQGRKNLVYERVGKNDEEGPLLLSSENAGSDKDGNDPPFRVANSMREVQPEINLLVSPVKENMLFIENEIGRPWVFDSEVSQ